MNEMTVERVHEGICQTVRFLCGCAKTVRRNNGNLCNTPQLCDQHAADLHGCTHLYD